MERTGSAVVALLIPALLLAPGPAGAAPGAPVISSEPLTSFRKGETITLEAKILSPAGIRIFSPAIFLRLPGVEAPVRIPLASVPGEPNGYAAQIPPNLTQADFDYFIEAFDEEGNGPSRLGSPEAPIRARAVDAASSPAPTKPPAVREGRAGPVANLSASSAARPWQHTAGVAGLTAGGALLAGALAFGGVALLARSDAARAADGAHFDAALKRAKSSARVANGLAAAGAVVGGVGAAFLVFGPKEGEGRLTTAGVGVGFGGAGLWVQGRF